MPFQQTEETGKARDPSKQLKIVSALRPASGRIAPMVIIRGRFRCVFSVHLLSPLLYAPVNFVRLGNGLVFHYQTKKEFVRSILLVQDRRGISDFRRQEVRNGNSHHLKYVKSCNDDGNEHDRREELCSKQVGVLQKLVDRPQPIARFVPGDAQPGKLKLANVMSDDNAKQQHQSIREDEIPSIEESLLKTGKSKGISPGFCQ